jgi:8-oxo-dGTP diphosphatase
VTTPPSDPVGSPATTPSPRPTVAVGAVVVSAGALLLVRRGRSPEAGRWSVPGGRVEGGETLAAALEREVREETGLDVRCGALVGWAERISDAGHFVILDFEAEPGAEPGAEPAPPCAGSDAADAAWIPLDEVGTLALVSGLGAFLVAHGIIPGDGVVP